MIQSARRGPPRSSALDAREAAPLYPADDESIRRFCWIGEDGRNCAAEGVQCGRLTVKPGITGLWQVSPHRNDPIHEHIEYDLAYIAHRGPILDLALIIATLGLANRSGA